MKLQIRIKLFFVFLGLTLVSSAKVWVYDCPGGEEYKSPDYKVSIIQGNDTLETFVNYSFGKDTYILYDWDLKPTSPNDYNPNPDHKGPARHSSASFSFNGEVKVRIELKNNAKYITLPLKSAKVLPSSYDIPCEVIGKNVIEFTLDRPEMLSIMPNYDQAWAVYAERGEGHVPIASWKANYSKEKNKDTFHGVGLENDLKECYQNPLFIFARAPEKRVPDSTSAKTLVVDPEDDINQAMFKKYDTIWFTPGVHDLSRWGASPWYQVQVDRGQTIYLEGGAYVKARFKESNSGIGPSAIVGRGIISGIAHPWVRSFPEASQVISIDTLAGITITDRACFGIYGGHYIGDVANIGAWHGNTDGPDYTDDCLIENCFLFAHDDNLKINNNTHARHCVIWQGTNAHPIMVKETFRDGMVFQNSIVEDIDIIAYSPGTDWDNPWPQLSRAAISIVTAQDVLITNFMFRDIRIEAPYVARIMNIYNLNTNSINPGWFKTTSESYHSKVDGIYFDNITVNTPVINYQSLLGSGYDDALRNVCISNMTINGTKVNSENYEEFFEVESNRIENLSFLDGDDVCLADSNANYIPVYGVAVRNCPKVPIVDGQTVQLSSVVAPADATDKTLRWSSSDKTVATVDENGLVTTLSPGTVKISTMSSIGGFSDECVLGVRPLNVTGLSLNDCPVDTLFVDDTYQLSVMVSPPNASDTTVFWNSSDETVAKIDDGGLITALSVGAAILTAKTNDGGYSEKCSVYVADRMNKKKINKAGSTINIYPNPVKNTLHIEFDRSEIKRNVIIYNAYGQMIHNEDTTDKKMLIDLNELNGAGSILLVNVKSNCHSVVYKVLVSD